MMLTAFHTAMTNWYIILFCTIQISKHDSDVLCHYKMWAVDAEWLPCQVVVALNDADIQSPIYLIVVAVNEQKKYKRNKNLPKELLIHTYDF